ncbi:hypothetical protein HHI36_017335 [Cryptolaemus montrouzieri]|uniref:Retinoid-inducible serine carboxypeptidase n=1 Tax=Cryptolaemus montrouzieri TaxID=559131 RepID=A0ABD2NNF5_9CUCU
MSFQLISKMSAYVFLLILSISVVFGKQGFGPTDQEWGYITVKEGGHMFWWLHYTTAEVEDPTTIPLVIWLQGGPGASSTGYGNLGEIGPIDEYLNERKYAWTKNYNVLFVDSPVGAGFSYVDIFLALARNNTQIADDFLVFMQGFYEQMPKLNNTPLYIFCESYGGKMTAEIALVLYEAQQNGKLPKTLKGIGLGDSWISPVDTVLTWGVYLLNQGLVDNIGYNSIQSGAEKIADALSAGKFSEATSLWEPLQLIVENATSGIDFYNVLAKVSLNGKDARTSRTLSKPVGDINAELIFEVMNNQVKTALGLKRDWVYENLQVSDALNIDFMKPVTDIVEKLLNETNIEVVVYNGELDLIVDTPGTMKWVNRLKWNGAEEWNSTTHKPMFVNGTIEGFYKKVKNFTFYWVSRAGHMVPCDNPHAMEHILEKTIKK